LDYNTVSPKDFGAGLRGMGLNLLVRDVRAHVEFLTNLFGMAAFQPSADFAILRYGDQVFQLHSEAPLPTIRSRGCCLTIRQGGRGLSCGSMRPIPIRPPHVRLNWPPWCCKRRRTNPTGCARRLSLTPMDMPGCPRAR